MILRDWSLPYCAKSAKTAENELSPNISPGAQAALREKRAHASGASDAGARRPAASDTGARRRSKERTSAEDHARLFRVV